MKWLFPFSFLRLKVSLFNRCNIKIRLLEKKIKDEIEKILMQVISIKQVINFCFDLPGVLGALLVSF